MQTAERGLRVKLDDAVNINENISVDISADGRSSYDFSCFGVDASNKLSDDRYMVFYNQTASPNREICVNLQNGRAVFDINLQSLPQSVDKLVFTASIDGQGTMSEINRNTINICQRGQIIYSCVLSGSQFASEKAVICLEIYRKGVWRANFVGQGFNGGLSDLLKFYGGEESSAPAPSAPAAVPVQTPAPAAPVQAPAPQDSQNSVKISLEKRLAKAPELVSLAKHVAVSLKKNNLESCVAKVGLVIDASGSMSTSYKDGTVQEVVNRILPLAVQFDDDGELDCWFFADSPMRFPSVNLVNYSNIVPVVGSPVHRSSGSGGGFFASLFGGRGSDSCASEAYSSGMTFSDLHNKIGYCNDEPAVMRQVIEEYRRSRVPAYVVFISDGGVHETAAITNLMIEASGLPIFWQFVGIRGTNYGILEHLDDMQGRVVDNASFFALDDFMSVDKTELYNRLLGEFPAWLKAARAKGIIN